MDHSSSKITREKRGRNAPYFFTCSILILSVVALDQVVKRLVAALMELHQSIPVIDHIFYITYIQNSGAAFSLLQEYRIFLILFSVLITVAALIFLFKKRKTGAPMILIAVSFIVGGGLGNLIDRVFYGAVIDYFDLRFFAVFNIADTFVCVGCGLLLLWILFFEQRHLRGEKK